MDEVNIWELNKVYIKPKLEFLKRLNHEIGKQFGSKPNFYKNVENLNMPFSTFKTSLGYAHYRGVLHAPLDMFIKICEKLNISKKELQDHIKSYKTKRGITIVEDPILPIKITPIFDMLLAHNIGDGTVINPKRGRQVYFGYRQFDKDFRISYITKLESVFGKIKFKQNYFIDSTRPYCPAVLSYLFFKYYSLNSRSFLSTKARLPKKLLNKDSEYLLATLLGFIIDEGGIDSTLIVIKLKNIPLTRDLLSICKKLGYPAKLTCKYEYGSLYIKREGMRRLFKDYQNLIKKYPEANMYKWHKKIEDSFKIYSRGIYKTKGNREIILNLLKQKDLTVNQMASIINMTRQGVRFHIHNLERTTEIIKKGLTGRNNIIYGCKEQ